VKIKLHEKFRYISTNLNMIKLLNPMKLHYFTWHLCPEIVK